jgi:uncharacterized protein (DUF2141 family)
MSPHLVPVAIVSSLAAATIAMAGEPGGGTGYYVAITVSGIRSAEGNIRLAVFADEASYLAQDTAAATASIPAVAGSVETTMCGLPAGTYGVSVFHDADADADEQLDANRLGIPTEDFGFSGGVKARFGKPAFERTSFVLGPDNPTQMASTTARTVSWGTSIDPGWCRV